MAAHCRGLRLFILLVGLLGVSLAGHSQEREPIKFPDTQYEPVEWSDLDGWSDDDHAAAFATFLTSCRALTNKRRPPRDTMVMTDALMTLCERAQAAVPLDENGARKFFEDNFRPLRIKK